ncbi:MAG TPA: hypothetical protein VFA01_01750 [Candidatus Dormibacteraeota bacterium]|jgi:hypothetical protein|nr:hypothetical protein [Candidatus Dormibacteraeota bacterium]
MGLREEAQGWFAGRVPAGWFSDAPEVLIDREEILVIGRLPDVQVAQGSSEDALAAARSGRIKEFRERTRDERIAIANEAQQRFGRAVSWGARIGDHTEQFTTLSVPVMTRLRLKERELLDALVDSGVARSRSHALAWCVKLVADHQGEWVSELKDTVRRLEELRASGPRPN